MPFNIATRNAHLSALLGVTPLQQKERLCYPTTSLKTARQHVEEDVVEQLLHRYDTIKYASAER